jgi:thioredoxin reductase
MPQSQTVRRQRSTVKGVYLAGDADDDVQFVVVAAAEGAIAAVAINKELNEEDRC